MEKEFIRVRCVKDIAVSAILSVSGGILIGMPSSPAINITGFFLIFAGVIFAFALKSGFKDTQTGERYCKKEHYFQHAKSPEICSAIASKPEKIDLSEANKGNSVRLDIYYGKSSKKAYIQLLEYIPYRYEPCSQMYEYEVDRVAALIK